MFPLYIFKIRSKNQIIQNYIIKPLYEAYNLLKTDVHITTYDENTITKKIVWHLKNNTSVSSLYQKRTIGITMRPKEHININQLYEPDIQITIYKKLCIDIEAKRIYQKINWSVNEYLSMNDGIGRFINNIYSPNEDYGSMIGYIQNGDLKQIIKDIEIGLDDRSCLNKENIKTINNCILSTHLNINQKEIKIYHLFFYFQ